MKYTSNKKKTLRNNGYNQNRVDIKNAVARTKACEDEIERVDNRHFLNGNMLISPTRFLSTGVDLKLASIPKNVLDQSRVIGQQVMLCLEKMVKHHITKLTKIPFLSVEIEKCFYALIQGLLDNEGKIKYVEQHFVNEAKTGHCYVDMVIANTKSVGGIVEIKTRGNNEVRFTDKMQLVMNSLIIGPKVTNLYVLVINKKTYQVSCYQIKKREVREIINMINVFFAKLDMEKYCLKFYDHSLKKTNPQKKTVM